MVRWLAVAAVLLLAGCSSAPREVTNGLSGELTELAPGIIVAVERAAVRVEVRDDAGLPVPGAHVQLTGTEHFGRTNAEGRIRFLNVTPGDHVLRVERTGFAVREEPLRLDASQLLDVRVHLLPTTFGSYRPHQHDMWRGGVEHTLFDGPFDYQASHYDSDVSAGPARPAFRTVVHPNRNESTSFALIPLPEEVDDQPNLVYPGAERIELTVTWDASASTLQTVGVAYTEPGAQRRVLGLKASGGTWTIPVVKSDVGHQRFTFWDFYLYPGNEVAQPTQWEPGLVTGPFQVQITVHRGSAVPVEPEHPEFWGDATRLVLMDGDTVALAEPSNPTGDRYRGKGHIRLPDNTLVPPGTVRLTVNHTWVYRDAEAPLAGTPLDMDYVLTWRTADQHRHTTPLSEYRRAGGMACGPRCVAYDVDVDREWPDAYYQTRSLWLFLPSVAGYEDEAEYRPDPRPKDHYLEIIAWRTAS